MGFLLHFNLEAIPFGTDFVQIDFGQDIAMPHIETARQIFDWQAQDSPGV